MSPRVSHQLADGTQEAAAAEARRKAEEDAAAAAQAKAKAEVPKSVLARLWVLPL